MSQENSNIKINLSGRHRETLKSDFLKWTVNGGRIIIVLTELIALGALLYRFNIDRKIIDLHDEINKADLFVKSQEAKENNYRSIHERLANIKSAEEKTTAKINIMNQILESISAGEFTSTNLIVSENTITLNGTSFSVFAVNAFVDTLKQDKNVTSISIDEVTSSDEGIKFKLNIELKRELKRA